ncbi:hypothetical protein [Leptospira kirschneri]|uniref:Uncharacterized protein n=2 Tax=Leptospira kirschneri TaxID=29507 RepID=A0A0E2B1I2_9LEPT|nr:hypothetical protein [Leptospira kirschneri]EKO15092.1 hypothetical protein LEP1GSC081_4404 [Leptospira kirschneri str. H1]EKO60619.1 hypothetical protein LEP1GSC082_2672 [Leptospira kirschneri str. H2]EMK24363.1 hypothetical protein LEP1GSC008_4205 [Leptospira kirschneri serovar Bulgarica str. Nikolaevo]UML81500.1 hypothetical protein FH602_07770 [Leptospira kirschneri]
MSEALILVNLSLRLSLFNFYGLIYGIFRFTKLWELLLLIEILKMAFRDYSKILIGIHLQIYRKMQ